MRSRRAPSAVEMSLRSRLSSGDFASTSGEIIGLTGWSHPLSGFQQTPWTDARNLTDRYSHGSATASIATEHGSFSRIRQVAPICIVIEHMVPSAHESLHPKRHLDRFSRFCSAGPCTQHSLTLTHTHIHTHTNTQSRRPRYVKTCV